MVSILLVVSCGLLAVALYTLVVAALLHPMRDVGPVWDDIYKFILGLGGAGSVLAIIGVLVAAMGNPEGLGAIIFVVILAAMGAALLFFSRKAREDLSHHRPRAKTKS